ncbi:FAD-binding oxidoreductase [Lampropedia puyangensis]|uniref:FAD-binding oxidoreductase n=1 Tax=Lampropedia puyangensis TaxID=1330072 RepID=A0A4S8FC38_9BURK|nr:FAD-dependent oxidoreductase [Lampropedia puyangensis]THU04425.1 FAD-binding oxidoreductase [Lampropedia puyangensis]
MGKTVIVLGAGMVGVSTAVHLQMRGDQVVLLDRRSPGRETSYGNAGLIQSEAVQPYGFPLGFAPFWKVVRKAGVDVNYHLNALPGLAAVLAQYRHNSAPQRYAPIALEFSRLVAHAIAAHQELITLAGGQNLVSQHGWIKAFRSPSDVAAQVLKAQLLEREFGVPHQPLDAAALAQLEPQLRGFSGGVHWTEPWAVNNPGALVQQYSRYFVQQGGKLVQGDALSLRAQGAGWEVQSQEGALSAEQVVVALGPWTPELTRPLGYRLPLFIKRGYHMHYQGAPLRRPVHDADNGFMLAPMQRGLRLTTGAEFARLRSPATPVQLVKAEAIARHMVDLGPAVDEQPWLGARPCTADMKPVIGAAPKHKGLWFHFGHAHQGFTLGPATAKLLAQLMHGEGTYVDPKSYSPERFMR